MTASDTQTEIWKPIPGAGYYEACSVGGRIRSVDRTIGGRFYPSKELTPKKTGTSPYWQVKLTYDDGKQRTRPVHALVLEAHRGLPEPGQQACHLHDDPDINDLSELRWDWRPGNEEDRRRNSPPPKPKLTAVPPPRPCVNHERCGGVVSRGGRRCHECVVQMGKDGAALLVAGVDLKTAAERLNYASPEGLHTLAVKYGGLRHVIVPVPDLARPSWHGVTDRGWLHKVTTTFRDWLRSCD